MTSEETMYMLNADKRKFRPNRVLKNSLIILIIFLIFSLTASFTVIRAVNSDHPLIYKKKEPIKVNINGFMPLYTNNTKGPITTNRELDDGTKYNMYNLIHSNNEEDFNSFFYNTDEFSSLPEIKLRKDEYACEMGPPIEGEEGTKLSCPIHYSISIDKAFFGRYANDGSHCSINTKGDFVADEHLILSEDCGKDSIDIVKHYCEGKTDCTLKAAKSIYTDGCPGYYKYLHVKYHCLKDSEIKKQKFAIVMYSDIVKPNSIYEHAISEFYQYSDIHGYKFILNQQKYDDERDVFYMKLLVVKEAIIEALKTKEYDWIFWVDGDVMLANPNIKLETFLPEDDKIDLIIAADHHGLNAGVFLIRVNSWSLNFMIRSLAYQYYNINEKLEFADQTSMNNVLIKDKEDEHYVIVPQSWFNTYPDKKHGGEMILHFAGRKDKNKDLKDTHREIDNNPNYLKAKTNRMLRKEVLQFYRLPKEKQGKIWL